MSSTEIESVQLEVSSTEAAQKIVTTNSSASQMSSSEAVQRVETSSSEAVKVVESTSSEAVLSSSYELVERVENSSSEATQKVGKSSFEATERVEKSSSEAIQKVETTSSSASQMTSSKVVQKEETTTSSTSESTISQSQLAQIQTSAQLASSVNAIANSVSSIQKNNPKQTDDFENLNRAVQILGKAKQLDDIKRYDEALKMYRQGIDMLLEELIIRPGTEQSRTYLRNKCNDFMNRIDQLKLLIQIENTNKEIKSKQEALKTDAPA